MLPMIGILNLSYNNIRKLTGSCLTIANKNYIQPLPSRIILKSNPIESIDDSFFEMIRKNRSCSYNTCAIELQNNKLTAGQEKEAHQKFYKATHTIPQRYFNPKMSAVAFLCGGSLAGLAAGIYVGNKLADYTPQFTKGLSVGLATGLGGIIGASRELLKAPSHSGKWMLCDAAIGATGAYFGAHKILNKNLNLAKILPLAITGLTGSIAGYFAGYQGGNLTYNALAKISHPEISWKNENWAMGHYTLEL
jgi:hypothetical protein